MFFQKKKKRGKEKEHKYIFPRLHHWYREGESGGGRLERGAAFQTPEMAIVISPARGPGASHPTCERPSPAL